MQTAILRIRWLNQKGCKERVEVSRDIISGYLVDFYQQLIICYLY